MSVLAPSYRPATQGILEYPHSIVEYAEPESYDEDDAVPPVSSTSLGQRRQTHSEYGNSQLVTGRFRPDSGYETVLIDDQEPVSPGTTWNKQQPAPDEQPGSSDAMGTYGRPGPRPRSIRSTTSREPYPGELPTRQNGYAPSFSEGPPPSLASFAFPPSASEVDDTTLYGLGPRNDAPQVSPRASLSSGVGAQPRAIALLSVFLHHCLFHRSEVPAADDWQLSWGEAFRPFQWHCRPTSEASKD